MMPPAALLRWVMPVLLALLLVAAWHLGQGSAATGSLPQGRYHSSGQIQMSNGALIDATHSIRFHEGRFYAISRQGDILQESVGLVERSGNALRLRVKNGGVMRLSPDTDNELIESLLYARHPGASITLYPLGGCLYARASLQIYCPSGSALSLR